MGNCWRVPEDHTNLLPISSTRNNSTSVSSSSNSHPSSATSDNSMPKVKASVFTHEPNGRSHTHSSQVITTNRTAATDLTTIKAAQSRNLFEHLPLINYNEKLIKQTE